MSNLWKLQIQDAGKRFIGISSNIEIHSLEGFKVQTLNSDQHLYPILDITIQEINNEIIQDKM